MDQLDIFLHTDIERTNWMHRFKQEGEVRDGRLTYLRTRYLEYDFKASVYDFPHPIQGERYNDVNYDTVINFGKHHGKTMGEIVRTDFDYAQFLIGKIDNFFMGIFYLYDIIQAGLLFLPSTITAYQTKRAEQLALYEIRKMVREWDAAERRRIDRAQMDEWGDDY